MSQFRRKPPGGSSMHPPSRSSLTMLRTIPFLWAFVTACIISGCSGRKPIPATVVPSCPPCILVEPAIPPRPEISLRYKIEEDKEWFALDRAGVGALREYVYQLEGSIGFTRDMIRESNRKQVGRNP